MDPLSALSVAGTIVQFIQFGTQILSKGHKIYESNNGMLAENAEMGPLGDDVKEISGNVRSLLDNRHRELLAKSADENLNLSSVRRELKDLSKHLALSLEGRDSEGVHEDDKALNTVCGHCIDIANELSRALEALKMKGDRH